MKGAKFGTTAGIVAIFITLVCYILASQSVFLYAGLLVSGLGISFATVGYPIVTQSLFGKKDYSAIYGIVSCASSIGSAIGSPVTAILFDKTGSYRASWIVWAVVAVVCLILYIFMSKIKMPEEQA